MIGLIEFVMYDTRLFGFLRRVFMFCNYLGWLFVFIHVRWLIYR